MQLVLPILYTTIIVTLVWARFRFFKVSSNVKKLYVYLYDPAAAIQITTTYYLFFSNSLIWNTVNITVGTFCYVLSLSIFWWALVTAKELDFAFSTKFVKLITTGPYRFVRHPFYLSYAIAWMTSSFLFNNSILWITLAYMMVYYYLAAKSEEEAILTSEHSDEYRLYSQHTGMLLPRITKWKN